MTAKKKSLEDVIEGHTDDVLEIIEDKIEAYNKKLRPYDKLKAERDKLVRARSALMGGNKLTGGGTTQVQQSDIVRVLEEQAGDGLTPSEIAEKLSVAQPTISSHLYRGRDERFIKKNNKWYLREPEDGVNNEDDIEDE